MSTLFCQNGRRVEFEDERFQELDRQRVLLHVAAALGCPLRLSASAYYGHNGKRVVWLAPTRSVGVIELEVLQP